MSRGSSDGAGNPGILILVRSGGFILALGVLALRGDGWGPRFAAAATENVYIISPHVRSKCIACHVSEDDETFLDEDLDALCSRCHDQKDARWKHHPLAKVPQGMVIPKYWGTEADTLTCLTCHTPGHEEDRDVPMLLRDGPYSETSDFCRRCHPAVGKGAFDPHRETGSGEKACPHCHDVTPVIGKDSLATVSLVARMRILCLMCHDHRPHPGGADHELRLTSGSTVASLSDRFTDKDQWVTCVSCHNPHIAENEGNKLRDSAFGEESCWRCHPQ